MQLPEILVSSIRHITLVMRALLAFLQVGSRHASAVLRRETPPSNLVVTTKIGAHYTGVLLVDEGRVRGALARLAESPPLPIDMTPPSGVASRPPPHATSQCGDPTPLFVEDEDETWGH